MKKIVYIGILILILTITSCNKQDIVPVSNEAEEVPTWTVGEKAYSSADNSEDGQSNTSSSASSTSGDSVTSDDVSGSTGDITDPNNDPESKKKRP